MVPVGVIVYLIPFYFSSVETKISYLRDDLIHPHTDCLIISIVTTINNCIAILFSIQLIKSHLNGKKQYTKFYNLLLLITIIPMLLSIFNKNILNSEIYTIFGSIFIIIRSYFMIYTYNSRENQNLFFSSTEKYEKSKINKEDLNLLGEKVKKYFETKEPYLNPEFSVKDISLSLEISTANLSQVFTEFFQKSFYQIINEYRVGAVIAALNDNERKKENLLHLAFACGFNSKSTFNDAFKKVTGKTPSEYKKTSDLIG